MSNIETTEVSEAPLDSGQVEGEVVGQEEFSEPSYFNADEYANHRVRLPVNGEEIEVPLSEALAGYQRQADYTRKTQEIAEQRKEVQFASAIQQALQNDPAGTIQMLTEHYGLNQQQASDEDDLYADPNERQLRQLESRVRSFEEAQAMQELEKTIVTLQSKYGEDFDANEVVAAALATGNDDLEAIYKQTAFDRLLSRQTANSDYAAKQAAAQNAAMDAKREANVVSGGSSAQGTSVGISSISSIADAFAAAKQQLGIN